MKKIFILLLSSFFAFILFVSNAHAAPYPLSVGFDANSVLKVDVTGVTDPTATQFKLIVSTTAFSSITTPTNVYTEDVIKHPVNYTLGWDVEGLNPNGTYYIEVIRLNPPQAPTVVTGIKILKAGKLDYSSTYQWPLTYKVSDDKVTISGKVDPAQFYNYRTLKISFQYSTIPFGPTQPPEDKGSNNAQETEATFLTEQLTGVTVSSGVFSPTVTQTTAPVTDGSYSATIYESHLNPNTQYFLRQIIKDENNNTIDVRTDKFNSSKGYIAEGSVGQQKDFDSRSYRLLAPWPGLAVLMDPSLCAEKQAAGTLPAGSICSINDFLNFAFKILIGLSAVVLVFRIIIEGYNYIVTDATFMKVKMKQSIWTSFFGLLLALSAYLILNTINPQLVSNDITITKAEVSLEDGDTDGPTIFVQGSVPPQGVYCPGNGKQSAIARVAQSWDNKITYSMIDSNGKPSGKNPAATSDGTAHLDCSGFVTTVLKCAGYTPGTDFINGGTGQIFLNSENITSVTNTSINGITLRPGDLVGWMAGEGGEKVGHVLIYIGNGTLAESHGGSGHPVGGAFGTRSVESYKDKIKHIKRIPG